MRLRLGNGAGSTGHHQGHMNNGAINVAATALTSDVKTGYVSHAITGSAMLVRLLGTDNSVGALSQLAGNVNVCEVLKLLSFEHTLERARADDCNGKLSRSVRSALPTAYSNFVADDGVHQEERSRKRFARPSRSVLRKPKLFPLANALAFLPAPSQQTASKPVPTHVF